MPRHVLELYGNDSYIFSEHVEKKLLLSVNPLEYLCSNSYKGKEEEKPNVTECLTCVQDFSVLSHLILMANTRSASLFLFNLQETEVKQWSKVEASNLDTGWLCHQNGPRTHFFRTQQGTLSLIFLLSSLLFRVYFFGSLLCHCPPMSLPSDPLYFSLSFLLLIFHLLGPLWSFFLGLLHTPFDGPSNSGFSRVPCYAYVSPPFLLPSWVSSSTLLFQIQPTCWQLSNICLSPLSFNSHNCLWRYLQWDITQVPWTQQS